MRLQKSPRSVIEQVYKAALEPTMNEEDDREFRDFVESVSVSQQELAAIVSGLESSGAVVVEGDVADEHDDSMLGTPAPLREFQRRFQRGWEKLATAFSDASAPNCHPRGLRRLKF